MLIDLSREEIERLQSALLSHARHLEDLADKLERAGHVKMPARNRDTARQQKTLCAKLNDRLAREGK